MEAYEETFDLILNAEEPEAEQEASKKADAVSANDVKQYRIYVSDTEGNPVEGAMVQMCDDSTCKVEKTGEDGIAVFKVSEEEYTAHILKAPKGYKKDSEEYKLPAEYSDLHITLEKE